MDRIQICNVCSLRFFPQTLTMVWSLSRHSNAYQFHIFLSDVTTLEGRALAIQFPGIQFYFIDQFADRQILDNALLLTDLEFNVALKATALRRVLEGESAKAFYCDSDLFFLASPDAAAIQLDTSSILLTPHQLSFQNDAADFAMARTGVFNSGFIGARGQTGVAFARWWEEKCARYCFLEPEEGIFVDQKWLDLVPALFDQVVAFRDPGYNVAYWNIAVRSLGTQTIVLHLSGLDPARPVSPGDPLSKHGKILVDKALVDILAPYFSKYQENVAILATLFPEAGRLPLFGRLATSAKHVIAKRYSAKRQMLEFQDASPRRRPRLVSSPYDFQRLYRTDSALIALTRRVGSLLVRAGFGAALDRIIALFRVLGRRNNWLG